MPEMPERPTRTVDKYPIDYNPGPVGHVRAALANMLNRSGFEVRPEALCANEGDARSHPEPDNIKWTGAGTANQNLSGLDPLIRPGQSFFLFSRDTMTQCTRYGFSLVPQPQQVGLPITVEVRATLVLADPGDPGDEQELEGAR